MVASLQIYVVSNALPCSLSADYIPALILAITVEKMTLGTCNNKFLGRVLPEFVEQIIAHLINWHSDRYVRLMTVSLTGVYANLDLLSLLFERAEGLLIHFYTISQSYMNIQKQRKIRRRNGN